MSRWVVPQKSGLRGAGFAPGQAFAPVQASAPDQASAPASGALERVVKYVPAEIVAAYTLVFSALVGLAAPTDQSRWVAAGLIAAFFAATIVYVYMNTAGTVRTAQLIVSPIAFLAWAYPISSALLGHWFVGLIAFLAQALVVLLSVFIKPREE